MIVVSRTRDHKSMYPNNSKSSPQDWFATISTGVLTTERDVLSQLTTSSGVLVETGVASGTFKGSPSKVLL
jgi:hypothetical protein